jgi:hypothetical protein
MEEDEVEGQGEEEEGKQGWREGARERLHSCPIYVCIA